MPEDHRCSQCGVEVPGDAPQGLCPNCVLKAGFPTGGAESGPAGSSEASFVPPMPAELSPHFPDLEIQELVGHGGMGVVYKARQKHLDRPVALKILSPRIGRDPAFQERFAREARALAMLNHPHIVAVHDFGRANGSITDTQTSGGGEDGFYYFVMEYVDGANLRRLLESGGITPKEALAIVPPICDALQYAHDHGVVHRDIKPENVLLDKEGRVKIADFGLAKLVGLREESEGAEKGGAQEASRRRDSLTEPGLVMGTPYYAAPEQMEHPQEVDHRADIYSLGVVFYQMLTGELPVGRFAPPSKKVHVDVRLDDVVLRALEKEPERRYQQASHVKTEVETITASPAPSSVGSSAASSGIDDEAKRQVRGPAIGLLVVGILNILTVFLFAFVFLTWFLSRIPQSLGHPSNLPDFGAVSLSILTFAVIPMALSGLTIVGAVNMNRLRSYGMSVAASILSIILPAAFIGLPVGVRTLVVLSRRDVRQAFGQNRARESEGPHTTAAGWSIWTAAVSLLFVAAIPVALFIAREVGGITGLLYLCLLVMAVAGFELTVGLFNWRTVAGKGAVLVFGPMLLMLLLLLGMATLHEFQQIHDDSGGWAQNAPARRNRTPANAVGTGGWFEDEGSEFGVPPHDAGFDLGFTSHDAARDEIAELKQLDGLWHVVDTEEDAEYDGRLEGLHPRDLDYLRFEATTVEPIRIVEPKLPRYHFSINPATSPATIDFRIWQGGEAKRLLAVGIYECDGNDLNMLIAPYYSSLKVKQRPTSFSLDENSQAVRFTLRRYEPTLAERRLQGKWGVTSAIRDGAEVTEEIGSRTLDLHEVTFYVVDGSNFVARMWGRYRVEPDAVPSQITFYTHDYGVWNGPLGMEGCKPDAFRTAKADWIGIYSLDGDRLKIAYRDDGPRPKEFASEPGSGVTLLEFTR